MNRVVKIIEYYWRIVIVHPVMSVFIKNINIDELVKLIDIKKILIIRYDRIGDMIVTTPIFRSLKNAKSDLYIGVVAAEKNREIIANNPFVDRIYTLPKSAKGMLRFVRDIRKERYDLIMNFVFIKMTLSGIIVNMLGKHSIKIGHGIDKYRYFYNRLLSLARHTKPMVEVLIEFLKKSVCIDEGHLTSHYGIFLDGESKRFTQAFLDKNHLKRRDENNGDRTPYLIFNISVNDAKRQMTSEQIHAVAECISENEKYKTVLLTLPDDIRMKDIARSLTVKNNFLLFDGGSVTPLLKITALIQGSAGVITPDTSTVHFASASGTPVIAFYSNILHEWLPYGTKSKIVLAGTDRIVSNIPAAEIAVSVKEFLDILPVYHIY